MISPQYRPITGGYERAAERLSTGLAARGHRVTVITERRAPQWLAQETRDGVEIRRLWCLYRPRCHIPTALLSFAAFLLKDGWRFQVWHLHQYGPHAVIAVALAKLLQRKIVLKLTCSAPDGLQDVVQALPLPKIAALLFQRLDAVAALSRETREEAVSFGVPEHRITILGNGIDTRIFRPRSYRERNDIRRKLGVEAAGLVVSAGRLAPQKNLEGLLLAWERALLELPPAWKLIILGEGELKDQLLALAKAKQLQPSLVFAGQQKDMEDWMGASDIYVLSSNYEGLSNSTLEAMASGLPVVSTRVSGSVETLEETGAGLVVDVGREDLLANALVRLAHDENLRKTMGAAGRKVIESAFSLEYVSGRYEQVYRDLVERSVGGKDRLPPST